MGLGPVQVEDIPILLIACGGYFPYLFVWVLVLFMEGFVMNSHGSV